MLSDQTYIRRRRRLGEALESGIVLLLGHDDSPMNFRDNPYPFRQDSSFLYYFGLGEPGMAGLIDVEEGHSTLFGHQPTLEEIVWTGERPSLAERGAEVGLDDCRPAGELADHLALAVQGGRSIHFLPPYRASTILRLARLLEIPSADVETCASRRLIEAVVSQRAAKSDEEIAELELALVLARDIHTLAMRLARPGMVEQEVVGAIEGLLIGKGSAVPFPVIFSVHGEVLHNHHHDNEMQAGELALLDAGALSPCGYASDITRTFPVGGRFSARQRQVYEIVLSAQQKAIEAVAPGVRFEEIHRLACRQLAEGLGELGILRGDADEAVAKGAHALLFPHGLGHMLGLDVHDMESLGEEYVGYDEETERSEQFGSRSLRLARKLQPGFVVTIEPGLYFIPQLIESWAAERRLEEFIDYRELARWSDFGGIRIEDDLLVSEEGHRVLGEPIPKSVAEVEALTAT